MNQNAKGPEAKATGSDFGRKGWEFVIYCLLVYFFAFAAVGTMGVLAIQLNSAYGWSMTALFSFTTTGSILCVVTYYILGYLNNKGKINLRGCILLCGIIAAILIVLWGFSGSVGLLLFVTIASLTRLVTQTWPRFFNDNLVSNWFPLKKGAVMGWITAGMPLGTAIGVRIFNWTLSVTGDYKACYYFFAAIFILLAIWGYTSFRNYPEELGYFPDNDKSMTREKANALLEEGKRYAAESPWTFLNLVKTWQFWALCLGVSMMEFYGNIITQMIANLSEAGYSSAVSANMMLLTSLVACVASVLWGILDSHIGPKKAILCILAVSALGGVSRFIGNSVPGMVWISLICTGSVLGGAPNMTVSLVSTIWGRYNFKKVFGAILAVTTCFAAPGATIHAAVAEVSNYGVAYLVSGGFAFFGLLLVAFFVKLDFPKKFEPVLRERLSKSKL